MRHALTLAERAAQAGDVPVGAVVVSSSGELLGEGWNQRERDGDPSAHAEVVAIRQAAAAQPVADPGRALDGAHGQFRRRIPPLHATHHGAALLRAEHIGIHDQSTLK